jgi:hypothetical protein
MKGGGLMQCLDRFNRRMSLNGGSLRKESILNTRKLLNETFADDPSFVPNVYFWRLGLKEYEHESPISVRLYGRSYSAANGVTIKFQTPYDIPVVVGDVIYDANENEYMICTEAFNIDNIHYKGKFTLCNWILKWQKKDGTILEYPCYDMNSTQYNSGEQSNSHFTVGSSQHMITLPSDENTVSINTPQRFYLDKNINNPTSFIVTQNDTTSHNYGKKGLVKITVYEYPNNVDTDRPDLGICDYIDTEKKACCSNVAKAIIEYQTSIIKSGGDSQIFVGKFYDENKNEITNITPHWTVICDFSNKLQIKEFDNCLSIGIDDDSYIDEEFKIICSDSNSESDTLPDTLIIKIDSLL